MTPVSSSRSLPAGARIRASTNTSTMVMSAPPKADTMISADPSPSSIAVRAETEAPPETPRIYGSASGLRNSTCNRLPASASSPPTANAVSARGRRSSRMTRAVVLLSPRRAASKSAGPVSTVPASSAASRHSGASNNRPASQTGPRIMVQASANTGQRRAAASRRRTSSGLTATGWSTSSSKGRSLCESL